MRYLFCLLTLFCYACQEEAPSRAHEIYDKLENGSYKVALKVDSIISLAQNANPLERYAIICWATEISKQHGQHEIAARYLKELSTLPFPEVKNKEEGFLILKQHEHSTYEIEIVDVKALSSLLFDMENRFDLTPEERYDFLTLKAGIYIHLFREYESGTLLITEAVNFGSKSGITGKKCSRPLPC